MNLQPAREIAALVWILKVLSALAPCLCFRATSSNWQENSQNNLYIYNARKGVQILTLLLPSAWSKLLNRRLTFVNTAYDRATRLFFNTVCLMESFRKHWYQYSSFAFPPSTKDLQFESIFSLPFSSIAYSSLASSRINLLKSNTTIRRMADGLSSSVWIQGGLNQPVSPLMAA